MQGLVHVADVVDQQTQRERALIVQIGQLRHDLVDIDTASDIFPFHEVEQISQGVE